MANSDTSIYGQEANRNSSQLDLPIVKCSSLVEEDLHKSRRKLCGYKESRRDSQSGKARAEAELSAAKKFVKELTLLIERSNRGAEFEKNYMEALKIEENGKYAEVMRVLEAVKEELSRLKFDITAAEKEVEELWFKTERSLRLWESLKKEIEVANEEHFLAELGKMEALREYKEIERQREGKGKEVLSLLVEMNKRIKEMLEEAERSKESEKELFETTLDVEMLETQLKLVKKTERRDNSMSRSNRGKYSLSVLKEATEVKKEELASVNAELFRLMMVMDALRNEIVQAKEETACIEKILRKDDVKIQKLNSKMLWQNQSWKQYLLPKKELALLLTIWLVRLRS